MITATPIAQLIFTDNAAEKVAELMREENNLQLKLRVYITGGGCSGFQYGFAFTEKANEDDFSLSKQVSSSEDKQTISVQLLVDPMSYQYLLGAEIDYKRDMQGERFVIRNPNAQTTCGCGSSFSI